MGVYTSHLPEQKKFIAIGDLEKCLDDKFIWPQPFNQYKGVEKYIQEGKRIFCEFFCHLDISDFVIFSFKFDLDCY